MSSLVWLCLMSFLCSGFNEGEGSLWYELIMHKLESMEQSLLDRIAKLETIVLSKQRSMETKLNDLSASVSALNNQSKQILKNHFDLVIPSCGAVKTSGVYRLQAPNMNVFCETWSAGAGWLIIQRRFNGETNFYRTWYDYRMGFGTVEPSSEFWLGLEPIHQIVAGGDYELYVYVENELKEFKHARYSQFGIAGDRDGYRLTIGGYSGTAGDALSLHNGTMFSTGDVDNDLNRTKNCGADSRSGWWFTDCGTSNLNGMFKKGRNGYGIEWGSWAKAGMYSKMMIRRKII